MDEETAYRKLQELLALAEEIKDSGHYTPDEIHDEIKTRLNEG